MLRRSATSTSVVLSIHRLKSITVLILSGIYACHEALSVDLVSKNATCADSSLILQALVAVLHTSSTCFHKHLNDFILISVVKQCGRWFNHLKIEKRERLNAVGLLLSQWFHALRKWTGWKTCWNGLFSAYQLILVLASAVMHISESLSVEGLCWLSHWINDEIVITVMSYIIHIPDELVYSTSFKDKEKSTQRGLPSSSCALTLWRGPVL